MQEIFIALILMFDASTGQLIGAATAATDSLPTCEAIVSQTMERAKEDMQIVLDGGCMAAPLLVTKQ